MEPFVLLGYALVVLKWGLLALGVLLIVVTLLAETRRPQWPVRMWDFPRSQIAFLAVVVAVALPLLAWTTQPEFSRSRWELWAPVLAMLGVVARQAVWIWPYVAGTRRDLLREEGPPDLRVLISNVLQQNEEYDLWRGVIGAEDADLIACAETDERWTREVGALLDASHPHTVLVPQDNMYGMAVWSRLPLSDVSVERIVQEDIPSIHLTVTLADGRRVRLHVLHPRPPAPQEDDSSAPRDAELIVMARRIERARQREEDADPADALPTVTCGDMNDVAWSRTTELFLKISGLLDPRRGRGLYNTFHAGHWWMRFPLDHYFVDPRFRLVEMRLLAYAGSDHYPVLLTLKLAPEGEAEQPRHTPDADDRDEAADLIEREKQREAEGDEEGHLRTADNPEAQAGDVRHAGPTDGERT